MLDIVCMIISCSHVAFLLLFPHIVLYLQHLIYIQMSSSSAVPGVCVSIINVIPSSNHPGGLNNIWGTYERYHDWSLIGHTYPSPSYFYAQYYIPTTHKMRCIQDVNAACVSIFVHIPIFQVMEQFYTTLQSYWM